MNFATAEGTARYASRRGAVDGFYRRAQDLTVSSLGIGSYLGEMDEATSQGYIASVTAAVRGGVNFIDTSLNYRHQMSEQNIGEALSRSGVPRDEVVLCTKAGYLVPNALPPGPVEIVGNMHSMAPAFLRDQLGRSLENLRVRGIDVFYLHNPETQLQYVAAEEFYSRVAHAFETLEAEAETGRIRWYGAATWNGFRTRSSAEGLSLVRMAAIAERIAGRTHRFRFIQLPFNLGMLEGLANQREEIDGRALSTIDAAARLGINVVASASLLQARLSNGLPKEIGERIPGLATDAQRALQFARSAPGVSVALAGMSNPDHVTENLAIASLPPADLSSWFRRP